MDSLIDYAMPNLKTFVDNVLLAIQYEWVRHCQEKRMLKRKKRWIRKLEHK